MWLFEQRGFMSVVAYDPKKDRNSRSKFSQIAKESGTHLLVRARIKEDLDVLKKVVPSLHVETDQSADYSFRAVVTRKQFKKFLAMSVDDIDYDSHFKEVVRDNSPKAEGRYSAMMSIWSSMAKLQPYSPYGGYSYSYGSGGYGGGSYKGKSTSTSVGTKSTPTAVDKPAKGPGYANMNEFEEAWMTAEVKPSFRNGTGPRTGFDVGDRVEGFFGVGEVKGISEGKGTAADLVQVLPDGEKSTKTFLSNFLIPENMPEDAEEVFEDEPKDLDWMYDYLKDAETKDAHAFDTDLFSELNDDAFELLTRLQERQSGESYTDELLNDTYDEVLWETLDDAAKLGWVADNSVPEKHVAEAMALLEKSEKKDEQNA